MTSSSGHTRSASDRLRFFGTPLATLAGLVALWQLIVTLFPIPAFVLPGPLAVWRTAAAFGTNWIPHVLATISVALAGFAVAIVVGLLLAVIIVHSRVLAQVLTPALVILQIVPKIAFAPLFLIWFGLGPLPIVMVTFLVAFFPMVVNGTVGLSDIERDLLDLTRVLRLNRWRVLWSIRFPSALPHLFSGLKVASTLAVIGAIIGEFVGSNRGLGYLILIANNNLNTSLALAAIALISLFGLILYATIVLLEMALVPWKQADPALEEVTQI
jgi:NitT/TauT family transport system permease protein